MDGRAPTAAARPSPSDARRASSAPTPRRWRDRRSRALPVRAAPTSSGSSRAERRWLLLAGREGERRGAGAIAGASDGYLHYYLGGTADEALGDSPMKNLFAAMITLAGELGLPLHLGGGVSPGDSLDEFKRGFANAAEPFRTHEVVCDPGRLRGAGAAGPERPEASSPPTAPEPGDAALLRLACPSSWRTFALDPLLRRSFCVAAADRPIWRVEQLARARGEPEVAGGR